MSRVATVPREELVGGHGRDPAKVRQWNLARHHRLIAERRCTNCGKDLPPACSTKRCPVCLRRNRTGSATNAEIAAKFAADLARIVETSATMSSKQQAERFGMTRDRVAYLRCEARTRGHDVPREQPNRKGSKESERWAALDRGKPCDVCELRGDHVCLPAINPLASGPGWL